MKIAWEEVKRMPSKKGKKLSPEEEQKRLDELRNNMNTESDNDSKSTIFKQREEYKNADSVFIWDDAKNDDSYTAETNSLEKSLADSVAGMTDESDNNGINQNVNSSGVKSKKQKDNNPKNKLNDATASKEASNEVYIAPAEDTGDEEIAEDSEKKEKTKRKLFGKKKEKSAETEESKLVKESKYKEWGAFGQKAFLKEGESMLDGPPIGRGVVMVSKWFTTICYAKIPVFGFIYLLFLALWPKTEPSRKAYARAGLIYRIFVWLIAALVVFIVYTGALDFTDNILSYVKG